MRTARLAPDSLLTTADQLDLYRDLMGPEATERQQAQARRLAGLCDCKVRRPVRYRPGTRDRYRPRIHAPSCARWAPWMGELID